jgi:hypothetical protein
MSIGSLRFALARMRPSIVVSPMSCFRPERSAKRSLTRISDSSLCET